MEFMSLAEAEQSLATRAAGDDPRSSEAEESHGAGPKLSSVAH